MVFNSFNFWLVFPFIFVLYWVIPSKFNRVRNGFLLLVSYLLYMNWKPAFTLVLLGVTAITYIGGGILESLNSSRKKTLCWCFAILGLLPLLLFKYYNFLNESLTGILESCGLHFALPGLNWAIPVGISFFTFQAVGYLLDVYHKRVPAEKNFWDYALFVSFFPQVTSGPISTAKDLMPQIKNAHTFSYEQGRDGLRMLLWGMFLKVVVADRLGIYVDTVYANFTHYSGLTCFIASVMYTIQIYGDFAGYSLMAIGIAKTMGFELINNFNRPYFTTSITEFWKRWHISFTRWLTTHVYINLGGNRCSKARQYLNIMVTFLVSGLWHGANWTFVIWGAIHGVLQVIEKALGIAPKGKRYDKIESIRVLKPIRVAITFLMVSFAWIFFRMPTLEGACDLITRIFTSGETSIFLGDTKSMIAYTAIGLLVLGVYDYMAEYLRVDLLNSKRGIVRWMLYLLLSAMVITLGILDAGNFIYVNF